jgi:hypothetical protein
MNWTILAEPPRRDRYFGTRHLVGSNCVSHGRRPGLCGRRNTANGRKYGVRLAILAVARSRRPKDGSSKEENHQCDRVTWYDKTAVR